MHIPVLLAPRGELCKGAFKKKYKKVPYIILLKIAGLIKNVSFQSTSDEETEAIKQHLGIPGEKIWYLSNIPSIPTEKYPYSEKKSGSARLIYLSRIVPKKNLDFALNCLAEVKGDVIFDIYGANEDIGYWETCQNIITHFGNNIIVSYKGNISHDEVQRTFASYDAMLFPTKSENFGHAIVEAFSVGCPPIISDQTPWTDLQKYNAGWAIDLNNRQGFIDAIQIIIDNDEDTQSVMRKAAIEYFMNKLEVEKLKVQYQKALEGSITQ